MKNNFNDLFKKRISKRYFYPLLSLTLVWFLLFTSVGITKAQQADRSNQPTKSISQTNNSITNQQSSSADTTISAVTSIKSISPQEININIPQSFSFLPNKYENKDEFKVNVVVRGENFPTPSNSENKFPIQIKIGEYPHIATAKATTVTEDRKAIFATFSQDEITKLSRGRHPVIVEVGGNATDVDQQVVSDGKLKVDVIRPISLSTTLFLLSVTAFMTGLLLWIVYILAKDRQETGFLKSSRINRRQLNLLEQVIIDSETNTFSLARTQFVWWLTIIIFGYLFLFTARGSIQNVWEFTSLSGFGYTFLISLVTLITAQVTSEIRGSKGSGEVHPAWSDLILHGGVLALERVQQVLWNIIIGIAFIFILLRTYATASSLPEIPTELLTLMGISAGGYISGKAVRKAGPNISQVLREPEDGKPFIKSITIAGAHFSLGGKILKNSHEEFNTQIKDTGVIVQMSYLDLDKDEDELVEIRKDDIVTIKLDPNAPMEFCRRLKVNLQNIQGSTDNTWIEKFSQSYEKGKVKITIINADGQRAVWDGSNVAPERETPPPAEGAS
ncbi:hypothetical protein H6G91_29355 [Nostoc muscorum FACHB-395]|nr:hypothetical protein [Desmonostoc muscorum FACHB-395]